MADKFQLKALITGVDKLSPMLKGVRKNALQLRKQLRSSELGNIGFSDVLQGGALATPFVMGARAAMRFESAMADVRKVVDFESPAQFTQMGDAVLDLSERLPMAAEGIARIVAAGGQAGIARVELQGFAEDAVKMGVAFDQTAEQAGAQMATWRTAFKLNQQQVVALADQINYLGNTGPANAQKISKIVTSIGPLGEVAGLASGQIAAIGATLAGMGIGEDVAATGMKNMVLALTAGTSASKAQRDAFKALRLDSKALAKGMQTDAQGTIMRVLQAVGSVERDKQAAVMTQLFGKESVGAITPLLTNLDLLRDNLDKVGDATRYAGSMNAEYQARAATTENALQLLQNRVTRLGISVGAALLPPFNDFMETIGPVITGVAKLAQANPWLIKGVLGAAAGFAVLRVGVMAATGAMTLLNAVTTMSPIGLIVRGVALAAGFLIANWDKVAPYWDALWTRLKGPLLAGWELFKTIAGFTPLGMIVKNWEPIVAWMRDLWERVKPYVQPLIDGAKWVMGGDSAPAASGPVRGPGATSLASQAAAFGGSNNLQGQMVVRFENAPPGMRAEPAQTNQSGLFVTPQVGYRSLAGGAQ